MTTPGPDPAAVGARIAQARRERGLSQDGLADQATFSKRALGNWERGESIPYRRITELAGLLGRTRDWILYGADDDAYLDRLEESLRETRELAVELRRRLLADETRWSDQDRLLRMIVRGLENAGIEIPREVEHLGGR